MPNEFVIKDGVLLKYNGNDSEITVPEGVTEIRSDTGASIFAGSFFRKLKVTKVILPSSLRVIGKNAFSDCEWLSDICLTDGIVEIGPRAFSNCKRIKALNIPIGVKNIGRLAFDGCHSLTELIFPEGVIRIGGFGDCKKLKKVSIPKTVSSIEEAFLYGCPVIKTIEVEEGNQYYHIADGCLIDTAQQLLISGVVNSRIPEDCSVTVLGSTAFNGRNIKGRFIIPKGITKIGSYTFKDCTKIEEIVFPDTIQEVGEKAFENTKSIKKVFASDAESWCHISFNGSHLGYSQSNPNPLNNGADLYFDGDLVKDLVIPEGVKKMGSCTFSGCTSIESVRIPKSVESFGDRTFACCPNLKAVYVDSLETWLKIVFDPDHNDAFGNPLCNGGTLYINGEKVNKITIPDSVTNIQNYSFDHYKSITEVFIHDNIDLIGLRSFDESTVLIMDAMDGWAIEKIPSSMTALSIVINRRNKDNEIIEKIVACVNEYIRFGGRKDNILSELKIIFGESIDYHKYDSFVINGAKKYKLSANGKLRAALYRLRFPIELEDSYKDEYVAICKKEIKKAISIAIEENDVDEIIVLFKNGAVSEEDKEEVLKLLTKSSNDIIKTLASTIDEVLEKSEVTKIKMDGLSDNNEIGSKTRVNTDISDKNADDNKKSLRVSVKNVLDLYEFIKDNCKENELEKYLTVYKIDKANLEKAELNSMSGNDRYTVFADLVYMAVGEICSDFDTMRDYLLNSIKVSPEVARDSLDF